MKIKQLKNITNKIRKYTPYEPPQPRNKLLPPTYNIVLSASPKGGGKTYNCIQLLTNYEESGFVSEKGEDVRMRTIWVSGGTSRSKQNAILDTLKTLHDDDRIDIEEGVDSRLKEIYEEVKLERDEIEVYNVYRKTYDKFMKSKSLSNLSLDELTLLEWKDFTDPKDDPDCPKDKEGNILYHPRMVFLILDDMIGSDGFSSMKRGNFLNRLAVKSRHESDELVGMNLFFITQSFKAIPAVIRRQTDIFVLLKSASRTQILDAISEEVGSHFSKEELSSYYDDIMKISYGSLILSIHKKEKDENRVRTGWDNIIEREKKYLV
ncbi:MAG: hypothetical protein OEY79_04555 [Anaplasmataceae bacterium]|nr:hypothetical protein [Anaplasmataceae bacterium]